METFKFNYQISIGDEEVYAGFVLKNLHINEINFYQIHHHIESLYRSIKEQAAWEYAGFLAENKEYEKFKEKINLLEKQLKTKPLTIKITNTTYINEI